jgi:uncharacterized protein (TIGR02453 family)
MEEVKFAGFGKNAGRFLAELAANNNKTWFQENRERYERELLQPAAALVRTLGPRLVGSYPELNYDTRLNGAGSIMRIHRDVRFSPDKSPYKVNMGIVFWIGSGKKVELPAFYFHLDAKRSFFYGGQHMFPKPVLERYRKTVDDDTTGVRLVEIVKELEGKGLPQFEEPAYKRVPRGYPSDHPRAELLRYGGLGVAIEIPVEIVSSVKLVETCSDFALKARPLIEWLHPLND